MEPRLQWIVRQPAHWVHWEPLVGGLGGHALLQRRYPQAHCYVIEPTAQRATLARQVLQPRWWSAQRWRGPRTHFAAPPSPVHMLWANMALHMHPDPQALLAQWHALLEVDGFLMFSCLGPDTLRELRTLYAARGWPEPSHAFTDMHDWGDMLVQAGFAEPVMDMERVTLSYSSPESLLQELRGLGRNLHVQRFAGLRGRAWHQQLQDAIAAALTDAQGSGRLELSFEICYGHAFKPKPRIALAPQTTVSLQDMRAALRLGNAGREQI